MHTQKLWSLKTYIYIGGAVNIDIHIDFLIDLQIDLPIDFQIDLPIDF